MTQAGVAYVTIKPDWKGFNRELSRTAPNMNREVARMGGQLSGSFSGLGKQAGLMFARSASAAAKVGVAGIAGGLVASVKVAGDFEQQISSLGAVAEASAKQMDTLRKSALTAGADTAFSAREAAKAQTELAKGGLSVKDILDGGLDGALALAAAGELELAAAAEATVNAMKLFGLRGRDATKVADAFATAANVTTADVGDFALALKQGGSAAKTVGLSFTETTAALEALAEVGIKGSDAGTSLKAALTQLAKPTKKSSELMEELGLKFFDAEGNIRPLTEVAGMLQDKLGGLTREQRLSAATTLVGTDGMRALLSLYDAGPDKIAEFEKGLQKQGTAAEVAEKKQDNLKGSIEKLGGSFETLGINVGTLMIPAIRRGAGAVEKFADKLSRIAARDDLDLGEKLQKSLEVARADARPWVDKLEKSIIRADLPARFADVISRGTDRIGQGINGGTFVDQLVRQIKQAGLPERLGELVSEATPKIASAAARAGLIASGSFVKAFMASDIWGRLALGGWLLSKLGGPAAFRAAGEQVGRGMAPGIAAGVGAGAAAGAGIGSGVGASIGAATAAQTVSWVRGPGGAVVAQVGTQMGKQVGQAIPPAVQKSGVGPRLAGMFRGYGPLLAASLAAVFGPELVRRLDETANPVAANGLPKTQNAIGKGLSAAIGKSLQGDIGDWAKFVSNPSGALSAGVATALGFGEDETAKLRAFGDTAEAAFNKLSAAKDVDGLRKLADDARSLAVQFPEAAGALRKFAEDVDSVRQPAQTVKDAIDRMASGAADSIKNLRTNVRLNTRLIKNALGEDTAEGKEALAANFRAAAENIGRSMADGTIKTAEGTAEIERLMVKALAGFGFSKDQALNIHRTGDADGNRGREGGAQRSMAQPNRQAAGLQRGGTVFGGNPTGDSVPALLERGEYVLNRNAVSKIGVGRLNAVNFGAAPRFQKGGSVSGSVSGDTDVTPGLLSALRAMSAAAGVPIFVQSGGRSIAEQAALYARYRSGQGNLAAAPSANAPHVRGVAADISPGAAVFGSLASRFGLGFTVPGEPWHIQLLDAAASMVASEAPKLARVLVGGPDSPLKSLAQGAIDVSRSAAQDVVDRAFASSFAHMGDPNPGGGPASGNGADLMRQISQQRGWNFQDWWALDGRETGHGRNLVNPTSTARLRGQFLDMNWGKYGPGSDPRQSPSMAQQIVSMGDYIADRYGNPSAALAHHNRNNWYQQGGMVELLAKGGPPKGKKAPAKGLAAPFDFDKALENIKTRKNTKLRGAAIGKLLDKIAGIGFPVQASQLSGLEHDVNLFGEFADRAGRLTNSDVIRTALEGELDRRMTDLPADLMGQLMQVDPRQQQKWLTDRVFPADAQQAVVDQFLGRVGGGTQLDWLTRQLSSMWDWRNVIADTAPLVDRLRAQTEVLLAQATERMNLLAEQIKRAEEEIARVERERERVKARRERIDRDIKEEMGKPAKKRDQKKLARLREEQTEQLARHRELNARLSGLRGENRSRQTVHDALKDDAIPQMETKRDDLATSHGNLLGQLVDAQGLGGSLNRLQVMPPVEMLGGRLFDIGMSVRELVENMPRIEAQVPAVSENQQRRADLLQELLTEERQRGLVREAAFGVFAGAGDLPWAGSFDVGGKIDGPRGKAYAAIVHGQEEVLRPDDPRHADNLSAGGGGVNVTVNVAPGMEWLEQFIDVRVDSVTRRQARAGGRGLPGMGGGGF